MLVNADSFLLRKRRILIIKKNSNRPEFLRHLPVPHTLFVVFAMRKEVGSLADAREQKVSSDVDKKERASWFNSIGRPGLDLGARVREEVKNTLSDLILSL